MELQIVAIGNRIPLWAKSAWSDYAQRFPKSLPLKLIEIPTPSRTEYTVAQAQDIEWHKIQRAIKNTDCCIALDENGPSWTSKVLAEKLKNWQNQYKQISFLIGGPDGFTDDCLIKTPIHWSLSKLTLPHALARVILVEQLYRGISILANHPYHRE